VKSDRRGYAADSTTDDANIQFLKIIDSGY
jgi:hypothetical protein